MGAPLVPQPPAQPPAAEPMRPDRGDLTKRVFAGAVPMTEVYNRIYQGRNLDLDRIENAVRWADTGVMAPLTDLSRETVRNDPTLASLLLKRFGNIRTVDWDLAAASGSGVDEALAKEIADATRQALVRMSGLRQGFYDLCWSRFDGRSALEIDWGFAGGRHPWMPRGLHRIHPARLSLGPERELRVVERFRQVGYFHPIGPALRDVPGKFIWDLPSLFSDYQEREGLAPPSLYWSFFKRFSWRHRMVLTELFGIPWRIVEADKDAPTTPEGLASSLAAAESLGSTTAAAFPNGHRLRLEAPHPESGELFQMTAREVNDELAKLITLQTSLTDSRDTNRASSVTATAQQDIVFQLDGNDVADRFQQQLVNVFVELNFGPDALSHAPVLTLRTQPARDRKAELDRVEKVLSFGVPVSEAEIREISGLRKPAADEPVVDGLPARVAPPSPPGAPPGGEGPGGGPSLDQAEKDADLQAERIVRELFGDGAAGDGRAAGGHPPFGLGGGSAPLHAAVHGSPDELVDRGVGHAAELTGRWAEAMARAAGAVPPSEVAMRAVLTRVALHLDPTALAEIVFRDVVHGVMLGALDAAWEGEHAPAVAKLDSDHGLAPAQGPEHLIPPGARGVKDFVATPFAEAVRDFAGRRILPREQFLSLAGEARRKAFTVARATSQDMLATAHDELGKAIAKGADLRELAPALAKRFTDAGWTPLNPSHVENVFRTNVMGAYGNGRRAQMTQPAVLRARPYWEIRGVDDSRTRPTHKAAHGKVLRADDPFWQKASPPFGYQCRCRVISRSEADVQKRGFEVVEGGSLDLPDEGFDAKPMLGGAGPVAVPEMAGAQPVPEPQAPRASILPEPSGGDDGSPPAPRRGDVPSEGPWRERKDVPALGDVASTLTLEHEEAVLRGIEKAGMMPALKRAPLKGVTYRDELVVNAGSGATAHYKEDTQRVQVRTRRTPDEWGQPFVPGTVKAVSRAGATLLEAIERSTVHEAAHHLHVFAGKDIPEVNAAINAAYNDALDHHGFISIGSRLNADEYFAETFVASVYHPAELLRLDPSGFEMVSRVRMLLGI